MSNTQPNMHPVYIGTKVSRDEHKQLRLLSVEAGLSLSSFLLSLLQSAIAEQKKRSTPKPRTVKPYTNANA